MHYELKHIGLGSVLRSSFIVILVVCCVGLLLLFLIFAWFVSLLQANAAAFPLLENLDVATFEFGSLVASAILNGLLLAIVIEFIIILAIIVYNYLAPRLGGMIFSFTPKETELSRRAEE